MKALLPVRSLLVGCAVLLAGPVAAETAIPSTAQTFRDFEHHHAGAARLELAQDSLGRLVPAGTSLVSARAALKSAGAFCGAADRCSFSAFEADHDMLRSIVWDVHFQHSDGIVSGLTAKRETFGS